MNIDLEQLQRELDSALQGLDSTQTQLRPLARTGCWSIQQIVEHLLLTYKATAAALEARIAKRSPTIAKPTLAQHIGQYTLLRLGYFPRGRTAPLPVTPSPDPPPRSGEQLSLAVAEHLSRLDGLCRQAEEIFGPTRRFASHIVLGPLSVRQWCRFQLVHGHHHAGQVLAIRRGHNIVLPDATTRDLKH